MHADTQTDRDRQTDRRTRVLHLRSFGVAGVVKSVVVDTTPRPTLVNAATERPETMVLGISDWMVNSVVAAPVMFVIIRGPSLTL
jgi:hypothetical protein